MAKTEMSYSSTSAAATSSWVDSGFDAQSTTSAPPAFSVRARLAVSGGPGRQAAMRWPASGCSLSKRSRIAASTGICRSAHSMRRTPSGASAMSFTSWRFVVAIQSFQLGDEQTLVLSLFPVECRDFRSGEPGIDGGAQVGLAAQPRGERDVCQLHFELPPEPRERAELVQLQQPVGAVAGLRAPWDDEPSALEVTQHARRPARVGCRLTDLDALHPADLNTGLSGFGCSLAPVAVFEPDDVVQMGSAHLQDRRVLERGDAVDRARLEAKARPRGD